MEELTSEGEAGLYGAACRCGRGLSRRGAAGCHHLLPPYLLRFSVPPSPTLPIASPLEAGDSITVHISLMPSLLNSIEVSLWHFRTRRPTEVTLLRAHQYRFGLTRLWSGAALVCPDTWLVVWKDPPNAKHTLGAGQRSLEARGPSPASPAAHPAGHTLLSGGQRLSGSAPSGRP